MSTKISRRGFLAGAAAAAVPCFIAPAALGGGGEVAPSNRITLAVIGLGGVGIISVASNEIPAEMTRMTGAALSGKWDTARQLLRKYLPLMQANFLESNPGPAKAVLAMMGRMEENYRLPLVPMKKENRAKLEKIAAEVGLLQTASANK